MADRTHTGPAFPSTPLLPCPFCGSAARWFRTGRSIGIECMGADTSDCNAQTDTFDPVNADAATGLWNRRSEVRADAIGDLLEVIGAMRDFIFGDRELTQQQSEELEQQVEDAISYACFADGRPQPDEAPLGGEPWPRTGSAA